MRRLIRNIEGERRPLIMHPRLHWLRAIDQNLRFAACKVLNPDTDLMFVLGFALWHLNHHGHHDLHRGGISCIRHAVDAC